MRKTIAVAAAALTLIGGAAFAETDADAMGQGLTMLEESAGRELVKIGITDVDVLALTLNQLAEIKAVTSGSSSNTNDMARAVRQVIERQ
jgi:hypothetical protein